MTISERLFKIMEDKNISMPELSRMTGISRHTIFDWQRRNTNPGADKIMIICEALNISPEELLAGTCKPRRGKSSMKDYSRISDEELEKMCFVNADKKYITEVISNSNRLVEEGKYKVIVSATDMDEDNNIVAI